MQSRSIRRSGQPTCAKAFLNASFRLDLIRGGHYGQRSREPHKKPNTWLHRPMLQNVKKALAKQGAVHTWHKVCGMVAFSSPVSRSATPKSRSYLIVGKQGGA